MPEIFLTPASSNVSQAEYDDVTQVLTITFNDGAMYDYFDVPPETYRGLKHARSAGAYVNSSIKDVFEFERVG